jgi:hypothetical protein
MKAYFGEPCLDPDLKASCLEALIKLVRSSRLSPPGRAPGSSRAH